MTFTPRHLRKRYARAGSSKDPTKKAAFRRCKNISKQFTGQSASRLESPALAGQYAAYRAATAAGNGFRRTAK